MNILLITLDQLRGDCLSAAGHPLVRTPNLDALAGAGVRLARHYSQAAPCGPGRACLYTGTYQLTNRVVANGTPLDDRFDNLARAARRAGYQPTLFGYTDQGFDPRLADGPDDPRLSTYEGVLPGFDVALDLPEHHEPWRAWLTELGHDVPRSGVAALAGEPDRPAEHSVSAFLTDHLLAWLEHQEGPWFAHASYLRPHPPYAAAGRWARAYNPDEVPLPVPPADERHPFHEAVLRDHRVAAPRDERALRQLRSQYYGMVSEVDHQLGRVWEALRALRHWDDTVIVVTSDHGEQLGDQGLTGKLGFFEPSYHVPGIVRDPRHPATFGRTVEAFTENVDVFPTICEAMGIEVPAQCDGLPLTPFLQGVEPPWWRTAAHWEFDWRDVLLPRDPHPWPWDRLLERQHLAVLRTADAAYVQFGDGSWRCFDLATDPTWRTEVREPVVVLPLAQEMLLWRSQHTDRTMTGMLLQDGGIGRWPPVPDTAGRARHVTSL
ncbi:MAG: sulfatase-like hydrolase/transferase [Acidimicrobiales bacterium]|nr:sulfatase-like hydrolase/transferase [Acidimicrobiales bacterium]